MSAHTVPCRLASAALVLIALSDTLPAAAGEVVTREFFSPALARNWSYALYLPEGYASSKLRYPVLYLLHANGGNRDDWVNGGHIRETADALIAGGEIPPCLIVMPDAGTSWYVDRKEQMETAVIRDLIPDVERNLKALPHRLGRVVAGISMGGYGAMRFALRYPEMFAAAALLSPAIYNPEPPENSSARAVYVFGSPQFDPAVWKALNYPALWDGYLAKQLPVPMYLVSGDDDELYIEHEAAQFYSLLRKNRQPAELRIVNGGHSWPVWESTIGDALKYIFRFATPPN